MKRALLLLASLAFLTAAPVRAQATPTYPDVSYANLGGKDIFLDIYIPPSGAGPFPCMIWIHGGNWMDRSRWPLPYRALQLLGYGIAVASIDYRLTDEDGQYGPYPVIFPAQIEDCKGAVRFLRANAALYNLDPTRFGCWGSSAGGHLSALLGLSGGAPELEGTTGGNLGYSSAVQAAAVYFGHTDLLNLQRHITTPPGSAVDHDAWDAPEAQLIGFDQPGQGLGVLRLNETNPNPPFPYFVNLVHQASPIDWVDPSDPPIAIGHGTDDVLVPIRQSSKLAEYLLAAGVPYFFDQADGDGHSLSGEHDQAMHLFFVQQFFGSQTIATFCSADLATATCPCGNEGLPGHGCANSVITSRGALLIAGGAQDPATMTLEVLSTTPNAFCIFLQGDAGLGSPAVFGDGLRCVGGHLTRLATKTAIRGSATFPVPADGDPSIQARSAALGAPIPPGATRFYQTYYRDGSPSFCSPPQGSSFNISNGMRITWP